MFTLLLRRDFYRNDGTTQLTMDIIKDHADSMYFTLDQSTLIAEFSSKRKIANCTLEIMTNVSALVTGDIEIKEQK